MSGARRRRPAGADAELVAFGVLEGGPVGAELLLWGAEDLGAPEEQAVDLRLDGVAGLGVEVDVAAVLGGLRFGQELAEPRTGQRLDGWSAQKL